VCDALDVNGFIKHKGLWNHNSQPIAFASVVDDFTIKCTQTENERKCCEFSCFAALPLLEKRSTQVAGMPMTP
jgi:hypothetical protein